MKIKLLLMVTVLAVAASMLFSCQFPIGPQTPPEEEKIVYNRIIYANDTLDLVPVRSALGEVTDVIASITPDTEEAKDGEIVFGDTNRSVTALAKGALENAIKKSDNCDVGYIVYSDGKNIAVYWNDSTLSDVAITKFISEFLSGKSLEVKKGTALVEVYNSGAAAIDAAWAKIEATADPDVYNALRELYDYYEGRKIAGWVANLYDPERGGFYYSISARDNEPFRPDLESTAQAIGIIASCGGGFNRNADLPEKIKADIVAFAKSTQSKKDGYFYHPQWPQDKALLQTDRYGRDVGSAIGLITGTTLDTDGDGVQEKQYPNYCILDNKCEKHTGTDEKCVFPIAVVQSVTSRLSATSKITDTVGVGVSAAVSKVREASVGVIAAATVSSHPDYSSREAFKTWLYAYNTEEKLRKSSGNAHNLAALHTEIVSHGMQDIVMDQLDDFQKMLFEEQQASGITPTGCWQETADYQAVWGMFKYMTTFYNHKATGRAVNPEYMPYMIETAITVIKSPPLATYHMNDLMNQWTCISNIITNASRYNPDVLDSLYEIIREDSVGVIEHTLNKIEPFKISDGSIGYSPTGNSLTSIYGVPISLGEVEGDCNAVNLCISLCSTIFSCMGYTRPPIMSRSDVDFFIEQISSLEPITKIERKVETIDFEGGTPDTMNWNKGDNNGEVDAVEDPTDSSNTVLMIDSPQGVATSDRIIFSPLSLGTGCAIFESDIYVESCSNNNYMMQMYLGHLAMITLHRSGNNVLINVTPDDGDSSIQYTVATVPMKKWFKLRVEYYAASMVDEEDPTPKIKIFVNDEYVTTSEAYMYSNRGKAPNVNYSGVELYSMRSSVNKIYFDNCYFASEVKPYDADNHTISDARG